MKNSILFLGTLLSLCCLLSAEEDKRDYSVGLKVGTLGVGIEVNKSHLDRFNFRLAYNYFERSEDLDDGDTSYSGDLELSNGGVFADWHPWVNGFRLTGGLMLNNNEVSFQARSNGANREVIVGGTTYRLSNNTQLDGKVSFNEFAPYLGLGWGRAVSPSSNWAFLLDLGVMFQGNPNAELTFSGTVNDGAGNPVPQSTYQSDLDQEKRKIEEDIESLEFYPVVSLGVTYRF